MFENEYKPLNTNLASESKNMKYIDILLHLKANMMTNNISLNCQCNSDDKYYCIPCKITCCSLCSLKQHEQHIIINMKENYLNIKNINKLFNNFSNNIKKSPLTHNTNEFKEKIIKDIDNTVDEIIEKLNKFRRFQKGEIENIFKKFEINKNLLIENINAFSLLLNEYLNKNKKFFNLNESNEKNNEDKNKYLNNDINNTYFLLGYDILNLTNRDINKIYKLIDTLETDLQNYLDNRNENFEKIKTEMNKLINIEKNVPEKDDKINNNDIFDLKKPIGHFMYTMNDLGQEHFINVKERINKYNKHIKNFKKIIYKIINKTGNLKEIEQNLKSLEFKKLKGSENLFSLRDQDTNNFYDKNKIYNNSSLYINKKSINSDDDICLNNPLINKYFSHLIIDLYDNNFKIISKELESSHADLQIKKKDFEDDEDESDIAKIIEGTNEIQIYEKKNKKMVKYYVKLTKNPFGYTKFPIGCRSILIGDKLYISGGKDEYNEYPTVLIFDRKTQIVKRIMDLRIPRAYHTMVYSEVFNTIFIFGGEGEPSVELFDPITNRWQLLPDLNIPRANLIFYCDSPRGILYAMFGNEGSILDNKYSDAIEFLDLKNIEDGWNILDYKNKSEIDLKSLMNIYPLNCDLILLYGGVVFRGNNKSVCIFNLAKSEIIKIDQKIMDNLRIEAKKSKKLNIIISGLSSKASSRIISNVSSKNNF